MSLKIRVSGNKAVLSGLDDYGKRIQAGVQKEMKEWALKTEREAKSDAKPEFANTINADTDNNGLVWTVGTNELIAAYHEFGTGTFVKVHPDQRNYAWTFYVNGQGTLRPSPFLFANARKNFEIMVKNIKELLEKKV